MRKDPTFGLILLIGVLTAAPVLAGELTKDFTGGLTPRRISVIEAHHDFWYGDNTEVVNDIAALGFLAIKIWPTVGILSQDMMNVYNHPNIDVIVMRPLQNAGPDNRGVCSSSLNNYFYHWENIDYGWVAQQLYANIGHLQKVVILSGWENDWQLKGVGCTNRTPSQAEINDYKAMLNARQTGIANARAANPTANLKVYHAVEVNHVLSSSWRVIDHVVPALTSPPDMISFSAWTVKLGSVTMSSALNRIQLRSGLPRSRVYIGEWGHQEYPNIWPNPPLDDQYLPIYSELDEAFEWGVLLGFMWQYRDEFSNSRGYWLRRKDGTLSTAFQALQDLRTKWEFLK